MEISDKIRAVARKIPGFSRPVRLESKKISKKDDDEASRIAGEMLAANKLSDFCRITNGSQCLDSILKIVQWVEALAKLANPLKKAKSDIQVGPFTIKSFASDENSPGGNSLAFSDSMGNQWEIWKPSGSDGELAITQRYRLKPSLDMHLKLVIGNLRDKYSQVSHYLTASRIKRLS